MLLGLLPTLTALAVEEIDTQNGKKTFIAPSDKAVGVSKKETNLFEQPASEVAPVLEFIPDSMSTSADFQNNQEVYPNSALTRERSGPSPSFLKNKSATLELNLARPGFDLALGNHPSKWHGYAFDIGMAQFTNIKNFSYLGTSAQLDLPLVSFCIPFAEVLSKYQQWSVRRHEEEQSSNYVPYSGFSYGASWGLTFPWGSYFGFKVSRKIERFPFHSPYDKKSNISFAASFFMKYAG